MEIIRGLSELIQSTKYRDALQLSNNKTETYIFLAQGEYNINYYFVHPVTNKKLVLRVNCGSQMHLDHQIEYEYTALKLLEDSGRTPKVFYVDGSKKYLPHGILVMEFLEGKSLDYKKDLECAADILADIHSVDIQKKQAAASVPLIAPKNSLQAIYDECTEMFRIYDSSPLADPTKQKLIATLFEKAAKLIDPDTDRQAYRCCINTELNSSNFLITGSEPHNYLIDWEKPLFGEPAQDIAHFLAPTTTFWKSDCILDFKSIDTWIDSYMHAVAKRFKTDNIKNRVAQFLPMTCLRGISWCAMAWVQYQAESKIIKNKTTWKKINQYLDIDFLNMITVNYFSNFTEGDKP